MRLTPSYTTSLSIKNLTLTLLTSRKSSKTYLLPVSHRKTSKRKNRTRNLSGKARAGILQTMMPGGFTIVKLWQVVLRGVMWPSFWSLLNTCVTHLAYQTILEMVFGALVSTILRTTIWTFTSFTTTSKPTSSMDLTETTSIIKPRRICASHITSGSESGPLSMSSGI